MKNMIKKIFGTIAICLIALSAASYTLQAQPQQGEPLDKIAAVVGNEIIMLSDVIGQAAMLAQQNPKINPKDTKVLEQVLDNLINEKLIITKAIEDSIVVSDDQIELRWQSFLQTMIMQFGSEARIEQVYKKSISRLKVDLRDDIRNKILAQSLMQEKFASIKVTSREVEDFYRDFKDSLNPVPDQYELYHIVKYVAADTSSKMQAFNLAKSIRDSITKGGNFADFAKRYSADPGTANSGGELGWFDKGRLFPEFEKAAFLLQTGELSLPVETPYGYHIIETLDKRKDAINTRHILIKVSQSSDDIEKTKSFLEDLKKRAESEKNFETLAKEYSEDKETKGFGGFLGKLSKTEMPQAMQETLEKLPVGEISEPFPYTAELNKQAYNIVFKKSFLAEHRASLEKDYAYIESYASEMKKMKKYGEFIDELRAELYWEIKK